MTGPLIDRIRQAVTGRYRIEREIGAGGMATVYLARDEKHGRAVAVKVLRPEVSAAIGQERFLREIQIAAQLAHPHLLPLYDSGAAAGLLYYVMPFVDGESLRDRLNRERQIPVPEAIAIARDVAKALAYAHRRGVLHRDIKPENILLTEGAAVVADFGVARALEQAGGTRLTETGMAVGTPIYMSPEQCAGQGDVDARSDIYALGCVLYEMLVGDPPFGGATLQMLLAQKSVDTPPSVRTRRPAVPAELDQILTRSLAPLPADRFQTVDALAGELERTAVPASSAGLPLPPPRIAPPRRWGRIVAGAGVVAAVGVAVALVVVSGDRLPPIRSLAVLPIRNATTDAGRDAFVDGLTDILTSEVAQIGDLVVKSRTSAMSFRNSDLLVPEIGRKLGADVLVESSLLDLGDSVRFTVQLIHAAQDRHLWTHRYDTRITDLPPLAQRVAGDIAEAIRVARAPGQRERPHADESIDPRAFELYVGGLQQWHQGGPDSRGGTSQALAHLDTSIARFQQVVTLEPDWSKGWAALAGARHWRASMPRPDSATAVRQDWDAAKEAAQRALELDEGNPDAHDALGFILATWDHDYAAAERHYRRAVELNPNADQWGMAMMLLDLGRPAESIRAYSQARERIPLSSVLLGQVAFALACDERFAQADSAFRTALQMDPTQEEPILLRGLATLLRGDTTGAVADLESVRPLYVEAEQPLGYAYARMGRTADARSIIRDREGRGLLSPDIWIGLGEIDRGLDEFRQELKTHPAHPRCTRPWYREYQNDPRLRRILEGAFPEG